MPSRSLVPSQPVGYEEGRRGGRNRLRTSLEELRRRSSRWGGWEGRSYMDWEGRQDGCEGSMCGSQARWGGVDGLTYADFKPWWFEP